MGGGVDGLALAAMEASDVPGCRGIRGRLATPDAISMSTRLGAVAGNPVGTTGGLLALQRSIGNRAVTRLVKAGTRVCSRCRGRCTCRAQNRQLEESEARPRGVLSRASVGTDPAVASVGAPPARLNAADASRDGLSSPRFAGEPLLEACFRDRARMSVGARDTPLQKAVSKIQQALVDLRFDLGGSGPNQDGVDGVFGPNTASAVRDFKRREHLGFEQLGDVGPGTMRRLDELFPPGSSPSSACNDASVDQTHDPLPAVPPFTFKVVSQPQLVAEVAKVQKPPPAPLAASLPAFTGFPVNVRAIPAEPGCFKCTADWQIPATFQALIAQGPVVLPELRRFFLSRTGDESGCPQTAFARLLEVRELITPEVLPFLIEGEHEHYRDFVRAFQIAGGRYLANVRRLTPERTHLRVSDPSQCEVKVGEFLAAVHGPFNEPGGLVEFLVQVGQFTRHMVELFQQDFQALYDAPDRDHLPDGPHIARPQPPTTKPPTKPNIDRDINPFGCEAFARKLTTRSFPGIPGRTSEALIKDQDMPKKQPWHVL